MNKTNLIVCLILIPVILIPVAYFQHDRIEKFLSPTETIHWEDLNKVDGLYYKKSADTPFTGKVVGIRQLITLKNGKEEGRGVYYYDNGQLERKGEYRNGKEEGLWVFYWNNGQMRKAGDYKNGKENGLWRYYYDNGQLERKVKYRNGKAEGLWAFYFPNGKLFQKGEFKNGKREGYWIYFSRNGSKDMEYSGTYRNGEKISD